jgi:hypothetical protein
MGRDILTLSSLCLLVDLIVPKMRAGSLLVPVEEKRDQTGQFETSARHQPHDEGPVVIICLSLVPHKPNLSRPLSNI